MVWPVRTIAVLFDINNSFASVACHLEKIVDSKSLSCNRVWPETLNKHVGTFNKLSQSGLVLLFRQIKVNSSLARVQAKLQDLYDNMSVSVPSNIFAGCIHLDRSGDYNSRESHQHQAPQACNRSPAQQ